VQIDIPNGWLFCHSILLRRFSIYLTNSNKSKAFYPFLILHCGPLYIWDPICSIFKIWMLLEATWCWGHVQSLYCIVRICKKAAKF